MDQESKKRSCKKSVRVVKLVFGGSRPASGKGGERKKKGKKKEEARAPWTWERKTGPGSYHLTKGGTCLIQGGRREGGKRIFSEDPLVGKRNGEQEDFQTTWSERAR